MALLDLFKNLFKKTSNAEILEIAAEISGNDKKVLKELEYCVQDTEGYFEKYAERFEERGIEDYEDADEDELQWIAMIDVLCEYEYVCECDYKEDLEDFLFHMKQLKGVKEKQLSVKEEWFDEDGDVEDWCLILDEKWLAVGMGVRTIDLDSDSYVLCPYALSMGNKTVVQGAFCKVTTEKQNAQPTVCPITGENLTKVMEHIVSVQVEGGEEQKSYTKEQLDASQTADLLEETLNGRWNKLVMELTFQEEGVYVKKLNKTVYQQRNETLVIYNTKEGLAVLYFCRKDLECYKLIADCQDEEEDVSVYDATLLKCIMHSNRIKPEAGLKMIFNNIEDVNSKLDASSVWCPEVPAGKAGFNKICVRYGVEPEK